MFNDIIKEIALDLNIKYTLLSNGWVTLLEYNGIKRYIVGNKFDLNSYAVGRIMDDKYAFYDILCKYNLPVCKHDIFYNEDNNNDFAIRCNSKESIIDCFHKYNDNVVIKPNKGSVGNGVYHITNINDLIKYSNELFMNNYSISMCPYYYIKNEYRVIVLDNQVKLLFKKIRPVVVGDGVSTLKELLVKFNSYYFNDIDVPDMILDKGEEYCYDFHFNLSRGSIASLDIPNDIKKKVSSLAIQVSKNIGIRFASIDIIVCEDDNILVMEANTGVTINKVINYIPNGYEVAKNIYKEAILKMFDNRAL